ncbi:MAG TPA: signal recognition particle protein [Candidatus Goldiibacteriota bacterium]|nr:signal recognition particle protein [Candidatus Goldiibacteriota bacterium]
MFESISSKLESIARKITGSGIMSEKNLEDSLKEIRMSLLEADVNYRVVKEFTEKVRQKAIGSEVLKSLSPGQQFVKIMHAELTDFLGSSEAPLNLAKKPSLILLAGLQGSGKTTTAGKLARYLIKEKGLQKVLLVAADTYRPAAKEQLQKLAAASGSVFFTEQHNDAVRICRSAIEKLENEYFDAAIFDTAGRLHMDEAMLGELKNIKSLAEFSEILLVADSMLGQESVNIAKGFNEALGITGLILTKTDGDARGGAALSMKYAANVAIKFTGTGEKLEKLERFHPDRMASRILGMGDVVTLVEKVQKNISAEQAKKAEEKIRKATFNFDDFLEQLRSMQNLGPIEDIFKMLPGASKMGLNNIQLDPKQLKHTEAMILSMTPRERNHPEIIDERRRRRIAKGSGTTPEKVSRMLKQFNQAKKLMKQMGKRRRGPFPGFPGIPGGPGF